MIIRYQPEFLLVIPSEKVGYLSLTHPCATLLTPEGAFSYDLHVLGTPPAFILSQNQTLELKKFVKHKSLSPSTRSLRNLLRANASHSKFATLVQLFTKPMKLVIPVYFIILNVNVMYASTSLDVEQSNNVTYFLKID